MNLFSYKHSINLLNEQFGKNGWIQNPPNSPDLAFPIEDLWAVIKPRVKRREPKSKEELKTFILQEWNSVPLSLIRNFCESYIDRVKKVLELNGSRLEAELKYFLFHLYSPLNLLNLCSSNFRGDIPSNLAI